MPQSFIFSVHIDQNEAISLMLPSFSSSSCRKKGCSCWYCRSCRRLGRIGCSSWCRWARSCSCGCGRSCACKKASSCSYASCERWGPPQPQPPSCRSSRGRRVHRRRVRSHHTCDRKKGRIHRRCVRKTVRIHHSRRSRSKGQLQLRQQPWAQPLSCHSSLRRTCSPQGSHRSLRKSGRSQFLRSSDRSQFRGRSRSKGRPQLQKWQRQWLPEQEQTAEMDNSDL